VIFKAGTSQPSLVVVLAGRTEVVDRTDGTERRITGAGPGEFVGELGLLTGQTAYATCVVRDPGEVLVVPASGVQAAIATFPTLSDVLVTAFSARRQLLKHRSGPRFITAIHEHCHQLIMWSPVDAGKARCDSLYPQHLVLAAPCNSTVHRCSDLCSGK